MNAVTVDRSTDRQAAKTSQLRQQRNVRNGLELYDLCDGDGKNDEIPAMGVGFRIFLLLPTRSLRFDPNGISGDNRQTIMTAVCLTQNIVMKCK